MFKYVLYLLAIMIAVGLAAGGIHLYRVAVKNKKEMAAYGGLPQRLNAGSDGFWWSIIP